MEKKEAHTMVRIRTMSLTALALALVLGSGLLSAASAQQADGSPPYQAPAPGGEIQLYSRSAESQEAAPAIPAPPRPDPDADSRPIPATRYEESPRPPDTGYQQAPDDETGPDWSSPGGSLQIQTDQGIRYVSGGIGEGERAELEALSGQFNLRLLFAMQDSGNYLADVEVRILDSRGATVLSAESRGPWFFAELPPGSYTVEVSVFDQSQRQTTQIGQRQSRLNFYWR
jgi:hypothetical protein